MNSLQRRLWDEYKTLLVKNGTGAKDIMASLESEPVKAARAAFEESRIKWDDLTRIQMDQRTRLLNHMARLRTQLDDCDCVEPDCDECRVRHALDELESLIIRKQRCMYDQVIKKKEQSGEAHR